jgi:hypothetical protein
VTFFTPHIRQRDCSNEKELRFSLKRKGYAALVGWIARGECPFHVDWTSYSECETSHDVDVTLFIVWNNVREAVCRLNSLGLDMKTHSEVSYGQVGPGETLALQEEAEDTEPFAYDGGAIGSTAPHVTKNDDGDMVIRFRLSQQDNAALPAWLASPSRPSVDWRTAGDRVTAGGVDVTLHVGSADRTAVLEALDSLALKMSPHFDILFDQIRSGKSADEDTRGP